MVYSHLVIGSVWSHTFGNFPSIIHCHGAAFSGSGGSIFGEHRVFGVRLGLGADSNVFGLDVRAVKGD